MLFAFTVMQAMYLSFARGQAGPLAAALRELPPIPDACQWAHFVRNHDELTLDKLSEAERGEVFAAFGPDPSMQLFGRGLRRRLPPMVDGDAARMRLAYSLLFSLPGTPVLFYGEEIGMAENLDIPGRMSVRAPMQWAGNRPNGGFSDAEPAALRRPVVDDPAYAPAAVNVADQRRDPDSHAQLARARHPHAQGVPRDRLGRVGGARRRPPRAAGDPLRAGTGARCWRCTTSAAPRVTAPAWRPTTSTPRRWRRCSAGASMGPGRAAVWRSACRGTATAG